MFTSNVDAVYDGHVGNHARFVSHDVINFIFSVSTRASPCPSRPCFFLKLCVHDLEILWCCPDSTRVSPLSFCWPRQKHPVTLSDVFIVLQLSHCMCLLFQDLINGVVEVVCLM